MNPMISIIVPVYNAEVYLNRCVDSILNQEYEDFELLLIDDGSSDSSGRICDEYAVRDPRVRVFHLENGGVSAARNRALDEAKGTYLQFLDSDDWITSDATKLLVRTAEESHCDMVITDFYRVVGSRFSQKGDIDEDGLLSREEFATHMMENPADFYYGVIWNKLYKRSIVEADHLRMDTDICWCEDFMFNLEYIRRAESVYVLKAPIYYYVKRKGSLATTQGSSIINTVQMKLMVFEYYNNFYKNVLDEKEYEKSRLQVYRFLVDAAKDGYVPPSIFPNTKKLEDEHSSVCSEAIAGEGSLMDTYRDRKLMEHYLKSAARKNSLTMDETYVLMYLAHPHQASTRQELSDFTDVSPRSLSLALQKLTSRELIKIEETRAPKEPDPEPRDGVPLKRSAPKKLLNITLLPAAEPVLQDIAAAQNDYDSARFAGFTTEEIEQYARLSQKIKDNTLRILQ
jgi:glycosyltransferase involved in cell wall biosynthesis/DNA-binding MarR family transcriptional regulator